MSVLAGLASVPRRANFLPAVLQSLRPQVDRLCVYLNGHQAVPLCVRKLADEWVKAEENEGAERKFHWADAHEGVYLSCDDDIVYPADYAEVMSDAVRDKRRLASAHGRSYHDKSRNVHDVVGGSVGLYHRNVACARPINHCGTGVMAFDTTQVKVPRDWERQNMADMQVAVWAQQHRVPLWLVKHEAHWLEPLYPSGIDPFGLYSKSQLEQHRSRNTVLLEQVKAGGWKVF